MTERPTATMPPPDASLQNERFGFTLFMSLCLHVVVILGVGFTYLEQREGSQSMEITLAQFESAEAPEEADFLAQADQQGSGTIEERAAPSTPVNSRFNDDVIREVSPVQPQRAAGTATPDSVLSADSPDPAMADSERENEEENDEDTDDPENMSEEEYRQTLASLQAQLDIHRQEYAQRPRRRTISSASTREAADARYLDAWRRRIEAVGNLNYPRQASAQGIYGQLRMMVALRPDGSVHEIRILASSGHAVLDEAATGIVRLAAPFEPFPEEIREDVDILEIVRTWQFHRSDTFRSF